MMGLRLLSVSDIIDTFQDSQPSSLANMDYIILMEV